MGKECPRPVASGSEHYIGQVISSCAQNGKNLGKRLTEKAVWHVVREYATKAGIDKLAPHDLHRTCARLGHAAGGELEQLPLCAVACGLILECQPLHRLSMEAGPREQTIFARRPKLQPDLSEILAWLEAEPCKWCAMSGSLSSQCHHVFEV